MRTHTKTNPEAPIDFENFRIRMQREMILRKLKEGGYRVTKQRIAVIDIILENDCGSCKEILYKTSKGNRKIGTATVYRTLNMLEEIGAINRRNVYKFSEQTEPADMRTVMVTLEDGGRLHLDAAEWNRVLQAGLRDCGYLKNERVVSVRKVYSADAN
nr:transcriptional repressor [uncultured Anaerotignum sp.]